MASRLCKLSRWDGHVVAVASGWVESLFKTMRAHELEPDSFYDGAEPPLSREGLPFPERSFLHPPGSFIMPQGPML